MLEKNLKLTKPRRALIDCILSKQGWQFKAEELLRELNRRNPGIASRATVYRTLDLFVSTGLLNRTRGHENSSNYALADGGGQGQLIDIRTGQVASIPGDRDLVRNIRRICAKHGFTECYSALEIFGEFSGAPARKPAARKTQKRRRTKRKAGA